MQVMQPAGYQYGLYPTYYSSIQLFNQLLARQPDIQPAIGYAHELSSQPPKPAGWGCRPEIRASYACARALRLYYAVLRVARAAWRYCKRRHVCACAGRIFRHDNDRSTFNIT